MAKGQPFSIRLTEELDGALEEEARRTRRAKGAVLEALADEALRTRRFPGIGFRGDDARRRAWVIGTGLDVWEICRLVEEFSSTDELVDALESLTPRHVRLALAYRDRYPDEIDTAIAENSRSIDELRELYPFVEVLGERP